MKRSHEVHEVPPHVTAIGRTHPRRDDANAFFADPAEGPAVLEDCLAQELAEEFLMAATGDESTGEERNEDLSEEVGGPFIVSSGNEEFDYVDED